MKITPVILAGGSGTRLWPISREDQPKQFLPLINSKSLFQDTVLRFQDTELYRDPVIVGNEIHRFLIQNQLKEIDRESHEIILEPIGKNTAPALTLASMRISKLIEGYSDDEVILVLPSDHYIGDSHKFGNSIKSALKLAQLDYIVTFGIQPNKPEIGYGYIRKGQEIKSHYNSLKIVKGREKEPSVLNDLASFEIDEFVEKPSKQIAETYMSSGKYFWNSGIFMMKASIWIQAITTFNQGVFDQCEKSILSGSKDGIFYRPNKKEFERCESIAIDYAVMEKIGTSKQKKLSVDNNFKSCVFNLDSEWSDVGSWIALGNILHGADDSNVIRGDVYTDLTNNSIVIATNRMVATAGIENLVIVETGDAVLVAEKNSVQLVKNIVNRLKIEERTEHQKHLKIQRPWGSFEILESSKQYQVKKLLINPNSSISLQFHEHRSEHWVVVKGEVEVIKGDSKFVLKENQSTYVQKGEIHRLVNLSNELVEIIEVQTGLLIDEQDITRIKDDYQRQNI